MKMDYSGIHRENEILEENLEERLGHISMNERRVMSEKGEELDELRRQLDEVTKLQTSVNSRNPADSTDIVSGARAVRYGKDQDSIRLTKAFRSRMKVEAEREKFSAKNFFNVRSCLRSSSAGLEFASSKKASSVAIMQTVLDEKDMCSCDTESKSSMPLTKSQTAKPTETKEAVPVLNKFRPLTAREGHVSGQQVNDYLTPRSKSAVSRSRSRRQLELLSRLLPREHGTEITSEFKVDWNVISERKRQRELQQLRLENRLLQGRIDSFLEDLEHFNKLSTSQKSRNLKETGQS